MFIDMLISVCTLGSLACAFYAVYLVMGYEERD
jgi:hypothetical protein